MKILALEFSSAKRSVAVAEVAVESDSANCEVMEEGGRETKAFAMIERALSQAKIEREQIECVAVGLGPGSYNGIRVAIAIAQGWQLATEVKVVGISSVECLAEEAQAKGIRGRAHVVVDAQRHEIYWATYELTNQECRSLQPLRLATPETVREDFTQGDLILGPEVKKWFAEGRVLHPRGARLAMMAGKSSSFIAAEKLEPIYLRETTFIKAPKSRIVL